jgi:hypothetical protein
MPKKGALPNKFLHQTQINTEFCSKETADEVSVRAIPLFLRHKKPVNAQFSRLKKREYSKLA